MTVYSLCQHFVWPCHAMIIISQYGILIACGNALVPNIRQTPNPLAAWSVLAGVVLVTYKWWTESSWTCPRNDADVLGIRNGCTFTGWTGSGYDGETFTVTAGPGQKDRCGKWFHTRLSSSLKLKGGSSFQNLRSTRTLTRAFSPSSVIAGDRTKQ